MDEFGLGDKSKKKLVATQDLASQGFDAWFENVMSKPFNTYDVALDMKESLEQLENAPGVPMHEYDDDGKPVQDRVAELEKARRKNAVKTHQLAANPNTALQASQEFYNAEKNQAEVEEMEEMKKALEKLVKAEMREADDEVKGLKERYDKVKVISDEWMKKADTLVKEWKLLDNTVNELNSWVATDRGAEAEQNFSLEKMESTLGELKNIFKEKERLVE